MEGQIGIEPLSFSGTVRFVCLSEGYFGNVSYISWNIQKTKT